MGLTTVIPGDQRPLADVLAELERSHGRVDIAQGGHTVAALVSAEYLESLEETIAVATDAELVAAIAEGEAGLGIPAHDVEAEGCGVLRDPPVGAAVLATHHRVHPGVDMGAAVVEPPSPLGSDRL